MTEVFDLERQNSSNKIKWAVSVSSPKNDQR